MKRLKNIVSGLIVVTFLVSCTTLLHVQMIPPLSAIKSDGITKKPITVGYIPPSVNKELTLRKKSYFYYGLSTTLKLSPYRDSTPVFKRVLNNVYENVVPIKNQTAPFASNTSMKYFLSITDIKTITDEATLEFGWLGVGNDYSQNYVIAFTCNIFDRANKLVWKKEIAGKGRATEDEVSMQGGGDSLAPTRALLAAFQTLQKELVTLELSQ